MNFISNKFVFNTAIETRLLSLIALLAVLFATDTVATYSVILIYSLIVKVKFKAYGRESIHRLRI